MPTLAPIHVTQGEYEQPKLRERLTSLELFGGAGGLALGLHAAGFKPVGIVENDPSCRETLQANGTDGRSHTAGWTIHEESVTTFDYSRVGKTALLSAGAPCQPFSHGGQRLGQLDDRNQFPQVVRALHELDPDAFLIENVRGLLFRDMELYFKGLLSELKRPSQHFVRRPHPRRGRPSDQYRVFLATLNAADFGLAQNRLRLFIVGLKPHLAHLWRWPEPTHSKEVLLNTLLGDDYWERHNVPKNHKRRVQGSIAKTTRAQAERYEGNTRPWQTVRDLLAGLPDPAPDRASADDPAHYFIPDARLYPKHTGSQLDWPAKTVKAGVHGCPGGEHVVVFDDGAYRYFTVRECALLQGFPADYAFPLHRSKAMRQIGNAVPLPVATAVGDRLAEVLIDG